MASSVGACAATTSAALAACRTNADADRQLATGVCANEASTAARTRCVAAADRTRSEDLDLCDEQADARARACKVLGQAPYAPSLAAAQFEPDVTNRYFPLKPGTVFTYESARGGTRTVVQVLDQTRKILGVTCRAVRDTVRTSGKITEDTIDYYAQNKNAGDVWYFGEETAEYENGHVVSIDGRWIVGEERAKPGIIMLGRPVKGQVYRQEFLLDEAEDVARIEDMAATFPGFGQTLKTLETTALEPDAREAKYYKAGVGNVATVDLETGEVEKLVNVSSR